MRTPDVQPTAHRISATTDARRVPAFGVAHFPPPRTAPFNARHGLLGPESRAQHVDAVRSPEGSCASTSPRCAPSTPPLPAPGIARRRDLAHRRRSRPPRRRPPAARPGVVARSSLGDRRPPLPLAPPRLMTPFPPPPQACLAGDKVPKDKTRVVVKCRAEARMTRRQEFNICTIIGRRRPVVRPRPDLRRVRRVLRGGRAPRPPHRVLHARVRRRGRRRARGVHAPDGGGRGRLRGGGGDPRRTTTPRTRTTSASSRRSTRTTTTPRRKTMTPRNRIRRPAPRREEGRRGDRGARRRERRKARKEKAAAKETKKRPAGGRARAPRRRGEEKDKDEDQPKKEPPKKEPPKKSRRRTRARAGDSARASSKTAWRSSPSRRARRAGSRPSPGSA